MMRHLIRREVMALSEATEYAKEISAVTVGERYGLSPDQVVDLSLNINVFGPPENALEAVRERLDRLYQYPDIELREFKSRLAECHGVDPTMIFPGDGLDEVLKLIAQTFIEPGDEAIIPVPTFPRYQLEVEIMGARSLLVPLTANFDLPIAEVLSRVSPRTKLIMLCSPNNPTGVPIARETIRELLALGPDGPLVVVDEAMIFPTETGVMDLVPSHPNLMVLRTFSKYFGLAGARVGYAVGDADLLRYMEVIRPPFNVNLLGEAAALGALRDPAFLDSVWNQMKGQREMLLAALSRISGVEVWPSETSVLTFDVSGAGWTGPTVTEALASRGVVVVDCRSYAGLERRDVIRISIGSATQNRRFIEALQGVLGNLDEETPKTG
jgi:histidinol-phosphate aminotransferase